MQIIKFSRQLSTPKQAEVVAQVVTSLRQGGLIIYPTETVYGAGVDATNQQAVDKLLSYKARREGKPLSIAVTDQKMAQEYVQLTKQAKSIYQQFLPGPVTVVSAVKPQANLAKGVASEFNTLGIRIPDYPLILNLVNALGQPITSTSANPSGGRRPYQVNDILEQLSTKQKNLIDLIIDAGPLPPREPSTVIDTTLSTPLTVRSGQVTQTKPSTQLISENEQETKQIAGKLLLKNWNKLKIQGLVIGLNGSLGAGKTIFAKGLAEFLQIKGIITSPTYTYLKEYSYQRHQTQGKLYHLDMWKIDSQVQLDSLKIKKLIAPTNLVVIEWWSQVKQFFPKPDNLITVEIEGLDSAPVPEPSQKKRKLTIQNA
ncbi:MAG: threonylcarbamoyl-AMP synthase [Candidatus Pacebacteria bacterium]|nr:threonylcarbamoyl-AMP synthase [Candidatus Paceibacterota bacterium]